MTLTRGNTISQRSVAVTSIRKSLYIFTEEYVSGYRIASSLILAATRVLIFLYFMRVDLSCFTSPDIYFIDIVTEARCSIEDVTDSVVLSSLSIAYCRHGCLNIAHAYVGSVLSKDLLYDLVDDSFHVGAVNVIAGSVCCGSSCCFRRSTHNYERSIVAACAELCTEVVLHSFVNLSHGKILIFEYMLLDSIHSITGINVTKCLRTCEVVDSSTFHNGLAALDTVINQSAHEGQRSTLSVSDINSVVGLNKLLNEVLDLSGVCFNNVVHGLPFGHRLANRA